VTVFCSAVARWRPQQLNADDACVRAQLLHQHLRTPEVHGSRDALNVRSWLRARYAHARSMARPQAQRSMPDTWRRSSCACAVPGAQQGALQCSLLGTQATSRVQHPKSGGLGGAWILLRAGSSSILSVCFRAAPAPAPGRSDRCAACCAGQYRTYPEIAIFDRFD